MSRVVAIPPVTLAAVIWKLKHEGDDLSYRNKLIAYHLGWRQFWTAGRWLFSSVQRRWKLPNGNVCDALPLWTSGIDAALTLVPPNCGFTFGTRRFSDDEPMFDAVVFREATYLSWKGVIGQGSHNHSLAIAICIAALQA